MGSSMTMQRARAPRRSGQARRLVVLQMKHGWRFDPEEYLFHGPEGERLFLQGDLPRGTRIQPLDGSLMRADPKTLSTDERRLARTVNLTVPSAPVASSLKVVAQAWPCSEEVWIATRANPARR